MKSSFISNMGLYQHTILYQNRLFPIYVLIIITPLLATKSQSCACSSNIPNLLFLFFLFYSKREKRKKTKTIKIIHSYAKHNHSSFLITITAAASQRKRILAIKPICTRKLVNVHLQRCSPGGQVVQWEGERKMLDRFRRRRCTGVRGCSLLGGWSIRSVTREKKIKSKYMN